MKSILKCMMAAYKMTRSLPKNKNTRQQRRYVVGKVWSFRYMSGKRGKKWDWVYGCYMKVIIILNFRKMKLFISVMLVYDWYTSN